MSSIPISQEGYQLMKKELDQLKKARPEVSEAIRLAREEGDLRENGGYHAARERRPSRYRRRPPSRAVQFRVARGRWSAPRRGNDLPGPELG